MTDTTEPTDMTTVTEEPKPLRNPLTPSPQSWAEVLAELGHEPVNCILYSQSADGRGRHLVWRSTTRLLEIATLDPFAVQATDALDMPGSWEEAAARENDLALLGDEIVALGAPLTVEKLAAWIDAAPDEQKTRRRCAVYMFLRCSPDLDDRESLHDGLSALKHFAPLPFQMQVARAAGAWSIAQRIAACRAASTLELEREELKKETERVAAAHANPTAPEDVPDNVREVLYEDEVAYLEPVTGFWFAVSARSGHARPLRVLINSTPGTGGFVDGDPYYNPGSVDEITIMAIMESELHKATLAQEAADDAESKAYSNLISTLVGDRKFRRDFLKAVAEREAKILCQDREVPVGAERRIADSLASAAEMASFHAMMAAEASLPARAVETAEWQAWASPAMGGAVYGLTSMLSMFRPWDH